jgi:hypothetical protein
LVDEDVHEPAPQLRPVHNPNALRENKAHAFDFIAAETIAARGSGRDQGVAVRRIWC